MSKILKTLGVVAMGLVTATGAVMAVPQTREKIADSLVNSSPKYKEIQTKNEQSILNNSFISLYNYEYADIISKYDNASISYYASIYNFENFEFSSLCLDTFVYSIFDVDYLIDFILEPNEHKFFSSSEYKITFGDYNNFVFNYDDLLSNVNFSYFLNGTNAETSSIISYLKNYINNGNKLICLKSKLIISENNVYNVSIDILGDNPFAGRYETVDGKYFIDFDKGTVNMPKEVNYVNGNIYGFISFDYNATYNNYDMFFCFDKTSVSGFGISDVVLNDTLNFVINGLEFSKVPTI